MHICLCKQHVCQVPQIRQLADIVHFKYAHTYLLTYWIWQLWLSNFIIWQLWLSNFIAFPSIFYV